MTQLLREFTVSVEQLQQVVNDIRRLSNDNDSLRAALEVEKIRNSSLQTQLRDAKAHIEKLKSVPAAWEVTYTPVYQK